LIIILCVKSVFTLHTYTHVQGEMLPERLLIPRLRVKRTWFKGLEGMDDALGQQPPTQAEEAGGIKDATGEACIADAWLHTWGFRWS
jgi:hypothetical protein